MDESPIRVQISDMMLIDGIAVRMSLRYGQESLKVMRITDLGLTRFEEIDPGVSTGATFQVTHEFGRALLDALLRYYQGATDMHTVRSDLLHERSRVDKMLVTISEIAKASSQQGR
jgi:hypothetical protein